jgi:hypothetical protein
MKFTVERKTLIKMLKLLSVGGVAPDTHLRIAAHGGQLVLTVEDYAGTSFGADVAEEGVCFFRHKKFLPLLRTYKDAKHLTIEVNSKELKFGSTTIDRARWEISLFENPAAAPQRLIIKSSNPAAKEDSQEQLEFL